MSITKLKIQQYLSEHLILKAIYSATTQKETDRNIYDIWTSFQVSWHTQNGDCDEKDNNSDKQPPGSIPGDWLKWWNSYLGPASLWGLKHLGQTSSNIILLCQIWWLDFCIKSQVAGYWYWSTSGGILAQTLANSLWRFISSYMLQTWGITWNVMNSWPIYEVSNETDIFLTAFSLKHQFPTMLPFQNTT